MGAAQSVTQRASTVVTALPLSFEQGSAPALCCLGGGLHTIGENCDLLIMKSQCVPRV